MFLLGYFEVCFSCECVILFGLIFIAITEFTRTHWTDTSLSETVCIISSNILNWDTLSCVGP